MDYLDPYKHYVFSYLTITTGLAHKVNMNAKALPSLVVVEPGVSVQVRGSNVRLEEVVHCYAKCLEGSQTISWSSEAWSPSLSQVGGLCGQSQ